MSITLHKSGVPLRTVPAGKRKPAARSKSPARADQLIDRALTHGRSHGVIPTDLVDDVIKARDFTPQAFESLLETAQAEGIEPDAVLGDILDKVPTKAEMAA